MRDDLPTGEGLRFHGQAGQFRPDSGRGVDESAEKGSTATTGAPRDGLPTPRRYWAALAIFLSVTLAVLDSTMVNMALPTMAREFGASAAKSVWIVSAYQIGVTMFLLPAAAAGEIFGYRRIYISGLIIFVLASVGCVLSGDLMMLSLARFAQGIGAAGVLAVNAALLRFTYPQHLLGRGLGLNALVVGLSLAGGPSLAAGILLIAPWQWLFAINLPLGGLAIAAAIRSLPTARSVNRAVDLVAMMLSAAAFGLLFLGGSGLAHGQDAILSVAELAGGVAAGVLLTRRDLGKRWPLLPLDLLRIPLLRHGYATTVCAFAAQTVAYVSLPFFLQQGIGLSGIEIGILIAPMAVMVAITAHLAGRLVGRFADASLCMVGLLLMATGLGLMTPLAAHASFVDIMWRMMIWGAGFGLFQTPNNNTLLTHAPSERSGSAGGMLATARLVGQTSGAVIVAFAFRQVSPSSSVPLLLAAALAAGGALSALRQRRFSAGQKTLSKESPHD
jgi:DHA2 family multidrug resistance protein-like MFS transporter